MVETNLKVIENFSDLHSVLYIMIKHSHTAKKQNYLFKISRICTSFQKYQNYNCRRHRRRHHLHHRHQQQHHHHHQSPVDSSPGGTAGAHRWRGQPGVGIELSKL